MNVLTTCMLLLNIASWLGIGAYWWTAHRRRRLRDTEWQPLEHLIAFAGGTPVGAAQQQEVRQASWTFGVQGDPVSTATEADVYLAWEDEGDIPVEVAAAAQATADYYHFGLKVQ